MKVSDVIKPLSVALLVGIQSGSMATTGAYFLGRYFTCMAPHSQNLTSVFLTASAPLAVVAIAHFL